MPSYPVTLLTHHLRLASCRGRRGAFLPCHPPNTPPSQVGELQGEVRRLAAARTDALERAEASEAHVMEVLQRQDEAREQAQAERRAFVEQMVGA